MWRQLLFWLRLTDTDCLANQPIRIDRSTKAVANLVQNVWADRLVETNRCQKAIKMKLRPPEIQGELFRKLLI